MCFCFIASMFSEKTNRILNESRKSKRSRSRVGFVTPFSAEIVSHGEFLRLNLKLELRR